MIKAIAKKLFVSPKTVGRHLANIRKRCGAKNGPEILGLFFKPKFQIESSLILTSREKEIFHLVLAGQSSRRISRRLGISFSTVRRHRENMLIKNNCANMRQLVAASLGPLPL